MKPQFYLPCGHTHGLVQELHDMEIKWGKCINCHRIELSGRSRERKMTAAKRTLIETPTVTWPNT